MSLMGQRLSDNFMRAFRHRTCPRRSRKADGRRDRRGSICDYPVWVAGRCSLMHIGANRLNLVAGACFVLIVRRSSTSPISITAKSGERISQAIAAGDTR
jgi:hypothetical protein